MTHANSEIASFGFGHLSWRSYNVIKKKAMEQEFSWSGLFISLSIAFFVVIASAMALNMINQTLVNKKQGAIKIEKIYRLEKNNYLNVKIENIHKNYLA